MVKPEADLKDRATERIEQWHKSNVEAAIAWDQPDTARLQIMEQSDIEAVPKCWISRSNTVTVLTNDPRWWLMLLLGIILQQPRDCA